MTGWSRPTGNTAISRIEEIVFPGISSPQWYCLGSSLDCQPRTLVSRLFLNAGRLEMLFVSTQFCVGGANAGTLK